MTPATRRAFRVLLGFWLAGWFINAPGNPGFLLNLTDAMARPLVLTSFWGPLTDPRVAFASYLAPGLLLPALVFSDRLARPAAWLMLASATLACLHVDTGSDATFVTSFWVALWALWLVHRRGDDGELPALAAGTAHAIVGLVFLGALVGKLTPAYANGDAFHGLYFSRGAWPYPQLRRWLEPQTVRDLAIWFSRFVLFGETTLALAPLLPARFVLGFYGAAMVLMMLARNYHLFSVLASLLGMLLAVRTLNQARTTLV